MPKNETSTRTCILPALVICPQNLVCSRGSLSISGGTSATCYSCCCHHHSHHHHVPFDSLPSCALKVLFSTRFGAPSLLHRPLGKQKDPIDPVFQGISAFQYGDPPADGNQGIQNWTRPHPARFFINK